MAPIFLAFDEVLIIHTDQIARYGGTPGVRDLGLLQSALAQPQATFGGQFLHADIYEMAAAYLFHLVQNHPFVDGNKRVGAAVTDIFLTLNGIELQADEKEYAALVLSVADGKMEKSDLAKFLQQKSR